jgi:tRNA (guanine37-N1)-methyltransferase
LWRRKQALRSTYLRRPDLMKGRTFTKEDQQLLDELMSEGLLTAATSRREEG